MQLMNGNTLISSVNELIQFIRPDPQSLCLTIVFSHLPLKHQVIPIRCRMVHRCLSNSDVESGVELVGLFNYRLLICTKAKVRAKVHSRVLSPYNHLLRWNSELLSIKLAVLWRRIGSPWILYGRIILLLRAVGWTSSNVILFIAYGVLKMKLCRNIESY